MIATWSFIILFYKPLIARLSDALGTPAQCLPAISPSPYNGQIYSTVTGTYFILFEVNCR